MQDTDSNSNFGCSELIAALLAVSLAAIAAPSPAASAEVRSATVASDDDDWNFLWITPAPAALTNNHALISDDTTAPLLHGLVDTTGIHTPDFIPIPSPNGSKALARSIEQIFVPTRLTPAIAGPGAHTSIALREDRWTMLDVDGVMRVAAYARGPLEIEDMAQADTPTPFPRGLGTGLSLVTATPVYVGATVKTDRSIYDIDMNRFRGARWTTSVFMGTDTALGPLYLGTTKEADGTRGAYLYIGKWF
jgi:hypothetical protein